jgi:FAD:protein FMN transferase
MRNLFNLVSVLLLLTATSCKEKEFLFNEGFVFGTVYHITYSSDQDLQVGIEETLARFDSSLSTFNPTSTISRFNRFDLNKFDLSNDPWMLNVVKRSLEITNQTGGAFDITVAPLVDLWGFGPGKADTPTQRKIDSIRAFVGSNLLNLSGNELQKADPRLRLDCAAVAKGYACDIVAMYLRRMGIRNYLVEIGGEMTLAGKNPKGEPWKVGINKPKDDSTIINLDWEQRLSITNKGIATSGNYRNFYVKDGKKYAHTIDPATGYPIQHSLLSATIVANDCLTADALATACMVMGVDSAMTMVERMPEVEGLFLCDDGKGGYKTLFTSGMKKYILKNNKL